MLFKLEVSNRESTQYQIFISQLKSLHCKRLLSENVAFSIKKSFEFVNHKPPLIKFIKFILYFYFAVNLI